MRFLSAFFLCLFLSFPCLAHSYLVYTVKGDVAYKKGSRMIDVQPGDLISDKTVLSLSFDGRLTVVDEKDEALYMVKQGIGTLPALIKDQQCSSRKITSSFLAFVKEKVTTKNHPKDVDYMQTAGVTYREMPRIPIPAANPGTLLNPLRESFAQAVKAIDENDADLLLRVSEKLDSMNLICYDFTVVSDYQPQSFDGHFVFDPLCLVDLAVNLDKSRPFSAQIADRPVPLAPSAESFMSYNCILCNYYVLQPGQSLELAVDCLGYSEIAVLSLSGKVTASFDGKDSRFCMFEENTTAHFVLTNHSTGSEAVMFAINAE